MAVSVLAAAVAQSSSLDSAKPAIGDSSHSSPRQFPTDLTDDILEECDETESEPPNEPVTPVSRQSQDFHALKNHDIQSDSHPDSLSSDNTTTAFTAVQPDSTPTSKARLVINTATSDTPPPQPASSTTATSTSNTVQQPPPAPSNNEQDPATTPLTRRSTRGSTSSLRKTVSNVTSMFKRSNSGVAEAPANVNAGPDSGAPLRKAPSRRWSMNRSSATTASNTPPSPGSPLEMTVTREKASTPTVPSSDEFFNKKKNRASTGLHFRTRVNFRSNNNGAADSNPRQQVRRRASSIDVPNHLREDRPKPVDLHNPLHMERSPWALPADTGTGVKARRMSLSLPDDFTVDVADLLSEFEYQSKLLGRHGKHLGKGATSKVTLMLRKGSPGELYAVKEFRGKSSSETTEEYEKKIKSEYTIAKSLHHPNIVETIRLATNHGRWNHVMEYCQGGDLFTLVSKGYLKSDDREKDRLCLFKQLVQGIGYLHANGIAHRDIKMENLLVTNDSKLKITDFGVSEVFSGIHPGLREAGGQCGRNMGEIRLCEPGICGSEPYIAPEVLSKAEKYDPRALDVWSAAIVMINLLFGGMMWDRADIKAKNRKGHEHYTKLVEGWQKWEAKHTDTECVMTDMDYPKFPAFDFCVNPPALRRVLLQMLHPDPKKRAGINAILGNRWFKKIECCQPESYDDPSLIIDASKKTCLNANGSKIFCHNHLPARDHGTHSLGKMPGSAGY